MTDKLQQDLIDSIFQILLKSPTKREFDAERRMLLRAMYAVAQKHPPSQEVLDAIVGYCMDRELFGVKNPWEAIEFAKLGASEKVKIAIVEKFVGSLSTNCAKEAVKMFGRDLNKEEARRFIKAFDRKCSYSMPAKDDRDFVEATRLIKKHFSGEEAVKLLKEVNLTMHVLQHSLA